jgi:glycosyltransferase involved in cell wall biosynthesis
MKSISVIIPTYNYGHFISQAIESVLAQTYPAAEVIVVDDGSTDDTADIVKAFGDPVKFVKQENSGVCEARNRGVRESTSDLLAFLDADDIYLPTSLEKQAALFLNDSELGLVHCGLRLFDHETGDTISEILEGGEENVADNLLLWEGPVIAGPGAIVVQRDAFASVGGFDTAMKVGEDWDFCYRIAKKYKIGFVAEPLVLYRSHRSAAHLNVSEMERGMSRFLEKAFSTGDGSVQKLRRRSYGNFHKVMAGSYYHSGDYVSFLSHALRSVFFRPGNIRHFIGFPIRRFSAVKNRFV